MRRRRLKISAGALLLAAAVYYIGDLKSVAAVLAPAAAHELGHILALWMLGLRVSGFRAELKGFCIDYSGYTGAVGHAAAAAAGPLAGFIYAWVASRLGARTDSAWLCLSAGASLLLSLFNLLPAMPLDGGRILLHLACALLGDKRGRAVSDAAGIVARGALLFAGGWLLLRGRGLALLIAAVWLLLYQDDGRGIVNRGEIL